MIIAGVDPGTARIGWAILNTNPKPTAMSYGCITTSKTMSDAQRLLHVYNEISSVFTSTDIDALAIEALYFASNAKTAIPVGQSRGVILLAAAKHDIPVNSYSPPEIKQAVCGHGHAPKPQVQRMVKTLLHLKAIPKPDDTADALAIALTHAYSYKMKQLS